MNVRTTIVCVLAGGVLCAASCRSNDQPTRSEAPSKESKPQRTSQEVPVAVDSGSANPGSTKDARKEQAVVTGTQASDVQRPTVESSPMIGKAHTLTTLGKAMTSQKKLPADLRAATFGAGCFWGVESTFRKQPGVVATSVGYSGGATVSPTYKQVCYEETGHAEVVDVVYDPALISYEQLLSVFFAGHNPTQVNRQGPDEGTQYRTVVFFHDDVQKAAAEKAKADLGQSGKWKQPIATQIVKFEKFWPAEDYHQTYLEKKGLDVCH